MKKDNVFEAYLKIMAAKEKRIDETYPDHEHNEKELTAPNVKTPIRMDSLSIDQINKLYGHKAKYPLVPKDMEYEHNIYELAHKDPIIISPSHDKINGLIESDNERNAIMMRIVRKNPDGQLDARKFAKQNLLLSLVRLGNQLDCSNKSDELRKLADHCLEQVAGTAPKQFQKFALVPALLGVAALLGGLYAKQHLPFHSDGWNQDYQKAISEIDDLLTSNDNLGIIGYEYNQQFIQLVNKLKAVLDSLNTRIQKALSTINTLQEPRFASELVELAKQPEAQEIIAMIKDFRAYVIQVDTFLKKIIADFQDPSYKSNVIKEKGLMSSIIDSTEVLHGGKGLIADDMDDVARALETLLKDVGNVLDTLNKAEHFGQNFINELQESQKDLEPHMLNSTPATSTTNEKTSTDDEDDKILENILNR